MYILLRIPTDANTIQAWVAIGQLLLSIAATVSVLVTLFLQQKTLQKQMEVQQMEELNNRIKLLPKIECKIKELKPPLDPISGKYEGKFYFSIIDNPVKTLKINFQDKFFNSFDIDKPNIISSQVYLKGMKIPFSIYFNDFRLPNIENPSPNAFLKIIIEFEDLLKNQYKTVYIFDYRHKLELLESAYLE